MTYFIIIMIIITIIIIIFTINITINDIYNKYVLASYFLSINDFNLY